VDPISGRYRLRELFGETLDMRALFAPDPRLAVAEGIVAAGGVTLRDVTDADHDPKGRHEARADATVRDPSGATYEAAVAVDETGRLRFGRCECPFFQVNLISRGPCEHLLAATLALSAGQAAEVLTQESA
jgi:predicted ArsR family transcriptional regulator